MTCLPINLTGRKKKKTSNGGAERDLKTRCNLSPFLSQSMWPSNTFSAILKHVDFANVCAFVWFVSV